MTTIGQLILLHVVVFFAVAFCLASLCGRMDHLTYEARMSTFLRRFLMPGKLAKREAWVRQQRLLSWIGLVFVGIVYVVAMEKILS